MGDLFEYDVVDAEHPNGQALADLLTAKADDGWRLVSHEGTRHIFERPRPRRKDDPQNAVHER